MQIKNVWSLLNGSQLFYFLYLLDCFHYGWVPNCNQSWFHNIFVFPIIIAYWKKKHNIYILVWYHHHPSLYTSHCWIQVLSQNNKSSVVPTRSQFRFGTSHPMNCFLGLCTFLHDVSLHQILMGTFKYKCSFEFGKTQKLGFESTIKRSND